jgi:hypothetical protein
MEKESAAPGVSLSNLSHTYFLFLDIRKTITNPPTVKPSASHAPTAADLAKPGSFLFYRTETQFGMAFLV